MSFGGYYIVSYNNRMHEASENFCGQCHSFDFKVP